MFVFLLNQLYFFKLVWYVFIQTLERFLSILPYYTVHFSHLLLAGRGFFFSPTMQINPQYTQNKKAKTSQKQTNQPTLNNKQGREKKKHSTALVKRIRDKGP